MAPPPEQSTIQTSHSSSHFPGAHNFTIGQQIIVIGNHDSMDDLIARIAPGLYEDVKADCEQDPGQKPPPAKAYRTSESTSPLQDDGDHPQIAVYTQITLRLSSPPCIPQFRFIENEITNPVIVQLCPLPYSQTIPGCSPSSLAMFSNTIQFFSKWELNQKTKSTIYDGGQVVRQEKGNLRLVAWPNEAGSGWIYECDLAGASWRAICDSKDPNRITIRQALTPRFTGLSSTSIPRKVSIVYHFEVDSQMTAAGNPCHAATVISSYGRVSGSSSGYSRQSSYPEASGMASPQSSTTAGHQARDAGYKSGLSPQPPLVHSQSYSPPRMGYQGQHYVPSPQGLVVTLSSGSSIDQSVLMTRPCSPSVGWTYFTELWREIRPAWPWLQGAHYRQVR